MITWNSLSSEIFFNRLARKSEGQMKKPAIRVTKWLGDIPVEACCSACPSLIFRAMGSGHRPNREEFQKSIQAQFDEHCKLTHSQNS
jgi:hypothetical protein